MAFLCSLLLIDFERKWCATHYSSLPVFRVDLLAYAYSVWCLLKALFLRNNNLFASGILLKKIPEFFYLPCRKKKKNASFIPSLTPDFAEWIRVSSLSMHLTRIMVFSAVFDSLVLFLLETGRESSVCVCIVHCSLGWMSSLNLFIWRRVERKRGEKGGGAIFFFNRINLFNRIELLKQMKKLYWSSRSLFIS